MKFQKSTATLPHLPSVECFFCFCRAGSRESQWSLISIKKRHHVQRLLAPVEQLYSSGLVPSCLCLAAPEAPLLDWSAVSSRREFTPHPLGDNKAWDSQQWERGWNVGGVPLISHVVLLFSLFMFVQFLLGGVRSAVYIILFKAPGEQRTPATGRSARSLRPTVPRNDSKAFFGFRPTTPPQAPILQEPSNKTRLVAPTDPMRRHRSCGTVSPRQTRGERHAGGQLQGRLEGRRRHQRSGDQWEHLLSGAVALHSPVGVSALAVARARALFWDGCMTVFRSFPVMGADFW